MHEERSIARVQRHLPLCRLRTSPVTYNEPTARVSRSEVVRWQQLMSNCTHLQEAAKPFWDEQLARLPCLVGYLKLPCSHTVLTLNQTTLSFSCKTRSCCPYSYLSFYVSFPRVKGGKHWRRISKYILSVLELRGSAILDRVVDKHCGPLFIYLFSVHGVGA